MKFVIFIWVVKSRFLTEYSHIRIKRAPPVSVFWVFVRQTPFILTPPV